MTDAAAVAKPGSGLYKFLFGTSFSAEYARKSLPVLVRWVEAEKANRSTKTIREHTYQELATTLGDANNAHPIHHALGVLGFALVDLQEHFPNIFGKRIPPIQLLVWTKGAKRPGDDAFLFIDLSKDEVQRRKESELRILAAKVRQDVIAYPLWREVLKSLNLQPLTIDLPDAEEVKNDPGFHGHKGGESLEHKRLKRYIARNYTCLGLKGKHQANVEKPLLSGDEIDVFLSSCSTPKAIGVEVKSRISVDADIVRGLFQCIKYRAVLLAEEEYATSRDKATITRTIEVLLVTERVLPRAVAELAEHLGVLHTIVVVPDSFSG